MVKHTYKIKDNTGYVNESYGKYIFFVYKYSKFNTKVQGSEKNSGKQNPLTFPQFHQNIGFL